MVIFHKMISRSRYIVHRILKMAVILKRLKQICLRTNSTEPLRPRTCVQMLLKSIQAFGLSTMVKHTSTFFLSYSEVRENRSLHSLNQLGHFYSIFVIRMGRTRPNRTSSFTRSQWAELGNDVIYNKITLTEARLLN